MSKHKPHIYNDTLRHVLVELVSSHIFGGRLTCVGVVSVSGGVHNILWTMVML